MPGVTTFAYMTRPVVEHFGISWIERGTMTARFVHPVYDGDEISVTARPDLAADADALSLEVKNSTGVLCAIGGAALRSRPPSVDLGSYSNTTLPSPPHAATPESFASFPTLGSVEGQFSAGDAGTFLELVDDDLPLYVGKQIAHPGWMLTWANLVLTSNFRLGPWIHTASDVQWLGAVNDGDRLSTRGKVVKTFERKGHQLVELDIVLIAGSVRPVMQVRHVAIYKPREVGAD